ncbi:hypothetical protein SAMCCGM7_Ch0551 [Sinorhizobium americanum CCGM7]|nr:hypothetical protein SAMCCGM7_Ch0551 [Sinorhizobium americanum CCGM7]
MSHFALAAERKLDCESGHAHGGDAGEPEPDEPQKPAP